jgi:hypothetical protein
MSGAGNSNSPGVFSGDIDPEIADLVGLDPSQKQGVPEFAQLFDDESDERQDEADSDEVDFTKDRFPIITKYEDTPKPFFEDKSFYKRVLSGEGEASSRFHDMLSKFLTAKDPQDRSTFRMRIIPAYWELMSSIAAKISRDVPQAKVLALRYGVVLPTLISAEQRKVMSSIVLENETGEPVHYVDEWLRRVASGQVNASAVDETKPKNRDNQQKVNLNLEKTRGQRDAEIGLLKSKIAELDAAEDVLREKVEALLTHEVRHDLGGLKAPFTSDQRRAMSEVNDLLRKLSATDKELEKSYSTIENISNKLTELEEKADEVGIESRVNSSVVVGELGTVRQMAKLAVGRQGNHFPVLMKQYFRATLRDIATRENVISEMALVEALDPSLFLRTFKQQTNRIVPHVILLPCYGDRGICWEPFERYNRASSRGRIGIPMYPKDLKAAVIAALADLRWQVAKEKAQHYWMEEGLTGRYYQWFTESRRKGDVKESFIQDYTLWITKESEGTQKLDREARGVFWRYVPFPQEVKDRLKNRGFLYNELYKKDINRSMSDGY